MSKGAEMSDFADLRGWLDLVDKMGRLRTVRGATWQKDLGDLAELAAHREGGPAIICDDIPGYPQGYRVLVNALRTPERLALAFRLPTNLSRADLTEAIGKKMKGVRHIPPLMVERGPILENIDEGNDIN